MKTRSLILAISVLGIGLAAYFSRRSPAVEPPCPPGPLCEEPLIIWPILLPILGGIAVLAVAVAVAVIVAPEGRPLFVPDIRSLSVAVGLALVAALLLALSLDLPVTLGYAMFGAAVAASLLGWTALRPRGSRARGLLLGIAFYLIVGAVSTSIMNRGFIGDLDLLAWVLQVLAWPGIWYLWLGEFLG